MSDQISTFFSKRPGMEKKYRYPGTFQEYGSDLMKGLVPADNSERFINRIVGETKRILPETDGESLRSQLKQYPVISYADHHGLLHYSLLYNSNILYYLLMNKLSLPYIVVFASGSIPLVNISYPRGFFFSNARFNFFSERKSKVPVYLFDEFIRADKSAGMASFLLNYNRVELEDQKKIFLEHLFFDCLEIEKAGRIYDSFSDQVTFLNSRLWKYFFDDTIRDKVPDIIYLQSNKIIRDLLIEEIEQSDSLISIILFNRDVRKIFIENFKNIPCCWGDNYGSQLFWGISEKKKTVPLKINNDKEILYGEGITLKLTGGEIIDALNGKSILPTVMLDFMIISFINGFSAMGGFNQVEYLPQMQAALLKSVREAGIIADTDRFRKVITDGLVCGMFPFHYRSSLDLIWSFNSSGGTFNGSLNRGITGKILDEINRTKISEMIISAIETMKEIV
jgi:hypothetical protein